MSAAGKSPGKGQRMHRKYKSLLSLVGIALSAWFFVPTIWQLIRWYNFPQNAIERLDHIRKAYGLGRDCGGNDYGPTFPDCKFVKACLQKGTGTSWKLSEPSPPGEEQLLLTHIC